MEAGGGGYRGWCVTKCITAMYGSYTSAGPTSTQVYGTQLTDSPGPSTVAPPPAESLMFTVPPPQVCPARHDPCTACISCTSCGRSTQHYHHSPASGLAAVSPTSVSSSQSEEDRTLALQLRAAAIFNKTDVAVPGGSLAGPPNSLTLPPPATTFPYPPPSHLTPYAHPAPSCDISPTQYCTCNPSPTSNCSNSSSPLPSCPYHCFTLTPTTTTTTSVAVGTAFYPNTVMSTLSNTDFASKTASTTTTSITAYLDSPSPSGQSCSGPSLLSPRPFHPSPPLQFTFDVPPHNYRPLSRSDPTTVTLYPQRNSDVPCCQPNPSRTVASCEHYMHSLASHRHTDPRDPLIENTCPCTLP